MSSLVQAIINSYLDWENSSQLITLLLSVPSCNLFSTQQPEDTFCMLKKYVGVCPSFAQNAPMAPHFTEWKPEFFHVLPDLFSFFPTPNDLFVFISSWAPFCWICCSYINPLIFFKPTTYLWLGDFILAFPLLENSWQSMIPSLLLLSLDSHVTFSLRPIVVRPSKITTCRSNALNSYILS